MSQDGENIDSGSGGSGKMLLVLGLLGGIAIGGGLGYYYSKQNAEHGGGNEVKKEVAKPKGKLLTIDFERLVVPIYQKRESGPSRFIGNYFVDFSVEVRGEDKQIAVKRSEPQLRHAFLSTISKTDLMREDDPFQLDPEKAGEALKATADKVMGSGVVQRVTISNAMRLSR